MVLVRSAHGIATGILLTAFACSDLPDRADVVAGRSPRALDVEPMTVELALVGTADLESDLTFVGNLRALAAIDIVSDVSGRLEVVHVELGEKVQQGQLLAQIRNDDLLTQVARRRAPSRSRSRRFASAKST